MNRTKTGTNTLGLTHGKVLTNRPTHKSTLSNARTKIINKRETGTEREGDRETERHRDR